MTYDTFVILAVDIFALLGIGVTSVCLFNYLVAQATYTASRTTKPAPDFTPTFDSLIITVALIILRGLLGELPPL